MNTDITFIIADNQDITRMGMHGYISAIFSGCRMIDVTDKKELMLALVLIFIYCFVIYHSFLTQTRREHGFSSRLFPT